ncbi:MAG: hypothetical protein K2P81_09430 [Bacteriovoracaceae bacterium]|nr:hypothetical protein [Bacteriovoracaceae bacterium]
MTKFLFLTLLMLTGACSLAPMMTTRSAKTLGSGNNRIQASPYVPVAGVTYERGVSDNIDLGASLELQFGPVYSAFGKYAFINQDEGFSLAASGGGFAGNGIVNSSGAYAGPIVSWRKGGFETFLFSRFNHVKWGKADLSSDNNDQLAIDIKNSLGNITFNYLQFDLGFNFYTNPRFMLGLGVSYLKMLESKHTDNSGVFIPEFMIGFNF